MNLYQVEDIKSLAEDDSEFINSIWEEFHEAVEGHMASLNKAFAETDLKTIIEASHAIKGVAANIGAQTIYNLSSMICQEARESKAKEANNTYRELRANLPKLYEEVMETYEIK